MIEHGLEVTARGVVVALKLRRLGRKQQRQRRLVQHQVGAPCESACALGIARRCSDQPLRQRPIAQTLAAATARQRDAAGADPDETHDGGDHKDNGRGHGNRRRQDTGRALDHIVAPGDLDAAGRLRNPGRDRRDDNHRDDEGDDANHGAAPVAAQRAPMRA